MSSPLFDPFDEKPADKLPERPQIALTDLKGPLKDIDLDGELFTQYARAKNLLALAETDEEIALNQKVQAMNSIVGILSQIVKLQSDVYNAQSAAELENTLISVLKKFPDLKDAFLKEYKKALDV